MNTSRNAKRDVDQMGWLTMPALSVFQSVGKRAMSHTGTLKTSKVEQTDEAGLHDIAKRLRSGNLQRDTSIFDRSCFHDFIEAPVLEMESAISVVSGPKAKAKAKAKSKAQGSLEDDASRPSTVRHKAAEKDLARIAPLRARRTLVSDTVSRACEVVTAFGMSIASAEKIPERISS